MNAYRKKYRDRNSEKLLENQRQFRQENREVVNQYYRDYYAKNKERLIPYINAHRKGRLKNATPNWADKLAIRHFYVNCPEGHRVDHIIPLHGKTVCGLHTLENLQNLPAEINLQKGNSYAVLS